LNFQVQKIKFSHDTVILGQTTLTPGLLKAIKQLKKGGTATAVVPYRYGIGSNAQFNQHPISGVIQLAIPHYSTLIYELKVDSASIKIP
jgi:FKBP-type peptidyl-prolyl cis-trans isomerase